MSGVLYLKPQLFRLMWLLQRLCFVQGKWRAKKCSRETAENNLDMFVSIQNSVGKLDLFPVYKDLMWRSVQSHGQHHDAALTASTPLKPLRWELSITHGFLRSRFEARSELLYHWHLGSHPHDATDAEPWASVNCKQLSPGCKVGHLDTGFCGDLSPVVSLIFHLLSYHSLVSKLSSV